MSTSGSAYTKLESLLLFQCLHAYGVNPSVFTRISDLLKNNPDINRHRHFQAGRLSPDALRNFYLDRLRREIEIEQDQAADSDGANTNGNGNGELPASRKRKLPTSSLPFVHESLQHQHLIPKLVTKLYASYRHDITEQIRADEDRYDKLQRELTTIERGEWDDQLRERASTRTPAARSPSLPKKSPHLAQKPLQPSPAPQLAPNGPRGATVTAPPSEGPAAPSPRKKQPATDQRRPPSTPQPLAASAASPNPSQPLQAPRFQQPPNTAYNGASYPAISPYPPGQPPLTPQGMQHVRPAPPLSPHVAPPGPPLQPQLALPYGNTTVPPYGPPPGVPAQYSPTHQRFPSQQPPGPPLQGVQTPHQQPRPQGPTPGHPPYLPLHPPPQAGFMLPPFQVSPQDPSRVHQQPAGPPQYPQVSTPASNRQQPRSNVQTPVSGRPGAPAHPLVIQARHSFSTPMSTRSPLSAVGTPLSAKSVWKRQSFSGSVETPASARPDVEPLDDFVPLLSPKQTPPKPKAQRKPRGKAKGKEKEPVKEVESEPVLDVEQEEEPLPEVETRSGRSRRKAPTKRTRPVSLASSRAGGSLRDRSRSQSILSHTETVAADDVEAGHQIKSERGTSVDVIDEESVDTPSQVHARRRHAAAHAPPSTRRKRNAREASLARTEEQSSTPGPARTIVAQRNFSKMCAPIMHDINSHKHASTFNTAVRAKDAEGYYDLIKRPTDLKSIQKAIATGSKQVAAAASDTPIGSPGGGGGGVVELPFTTEHIPPKSIVNAAQLEKELMRMFVNAIMFNPGEDGVVEDARDMFESVERSVKTWRDVERGRGVARTEVEDTPVAEEEEEPTQVSKRRKV